MLCLYRGSGRWDLRILSVSPEAEPFLAQGIYPQVLYAPGPTRHEQWFPVGAGLVATPLGDAALASRQRWGLTSSLMPAAWLIQVDQTRRRVHGEPENPGDVELHRGDSFLIIWEEDGWTLFERYPGDLAAWTTTVMPAGTEVSHHNHILLPSQQVYDGEDPQAPEPNASSSPARARGHHSGDGTPHKAAPPRPPSNSTSSGDRSERAWASEEEGEQQGEHDRTELMQRTPLQPKGETTPSKQAKAPTTAATPRSGASEEPEPRRSSSSHQKRGQPLPAQQQPRQAYASPHPLFGAPSTQTQEEMLAVAHLVETGQANSVAWTGGRNPCQDTLEATVPETTPPTQQQRGQPPGSPARKRSRTGEAQQQPEPEPGAASANPAQERRPNNTAASQQPHLEHHQPAGHSPPQQTLGQSNTATGSQQPHLEHHQPTAALQQRRDQPQQETSAYMILRAQQLVAQLMPTLVGDQVPLAAEALGQLQMWTRGLWGHDIQRVGDSATDSCGSMADTVPWHPPEPTRGQEEGHARPLPSPGDELWRPAGGQSRQSRGRELNDCSLDSADMPGTETEDEAFGLQRRRRSTLASSRRRTATTTEPGAKATEQGSGTEAKSHRRRRLHAAMTDD